MLWTLELSVATFDENGRRVYDQPRITFTADQAVINVIEGKLIKVISDLNAESAARQAGKKK